MIVCVEAQVIWEDDQTVADQVSRWHGYREADMCTVWGPPSDATDDRWWDTGSHEDTAGYERGNAQVYNHMAYDRF